MQALQDHDTVINVIDAVVTRTEKFSEVARMERDCVEATLGGNAFYARAPATRSVWSPSEDWRVAGTTTSVLEAECSLANIIIMSD